MNDKKNNMRQNILINIALRYKWQTKTQSVHKQNKKSCNQAGENTL